MKELQRPEVLAPAGDKERLEAAVRFGADAVYLGGKEFTMRAAAAGFNPDELAAAVRYAHNQNVKVYLTANTLPREDEVDGLPAFLHMAEDAGVDAIIASDLGVLLAARREVPKVEVHVSTQTGVVNHLTATELYHLGAARVVLARELSLQEIKSIRRRTPPELQIECFVHGAMCMSFSGRCLLSNYMTGRDANRGECAQPCRWGYHLVEEKRPGQYFPIFEDESGSYILNAKDLCMIEQIDQLANAGITSFKIEGRAKSAYYVAVVTNAYRCAVDEYLRDPAHFKLPGWIGEEVTKVSHREYSTGFYFGRPKEGQCYQSGGYVRRWDVAGIVQEYKDGKLLVSQRNVLCTGDQAELLQPGKPPLPITIEHMTNEEGEEITRANHPMMMVKIPCAQEVEPGSILRKSREE